MFPEIVLGHLVGDYMLQNNWMAHNKGKYNLLGWSTCLIHCVLYTLAVSVATWNFSIIWLAIIFLSHFPIDKFALGDKYCTYVKGNSVSTFFKDPINAEYSVLNILLAGFATFVHVAVDNTMHLVIMYYSWKYLYG